MQYIIKYKLYMINTEIFGCFLLWQCGFIFIPFLALSLSFCSFTEVTSVRSVLEISKLNSFFFFF